MVQLAQHELQGGLGVSILQADRLLVTRGSQPVQHQPGQPAAWRVKGALLLQPEQLQVGMLQVLVAFSIQVGHACLSGG